MKSSRISKGFTLIISLLVTSIVLSVGIALANIAFKEQQLSSTQNDSLKAFYAADAGIECALFWDLHFDDVSRGAPPVSTEPFPISNPPVGFNQPLTASDVTNMTCLKQSIEAGTFLAQAGSPSSGKITFPKTTSLVIGGVAGETTKPCVKVTVEKIWSDANVVAGSTVGVVDPGEISVTITSAGFSTCDLNTPRRVERILKQSYFSDK